MDANLKTFLWMLLAAFVTYVGQRIARGKDESQAEKKKLKDEVAELKGQMAVLKAESVPIQAAFQAMLIAKLTHFHTPEMDLLLKKLGPPNILTAEEMEQLEAGLKERIVVVDDKIDEEERIAADLLPGVVKINQIDTERQIQSKTETVLVSQPVPESNHEEEETD